MNNQIFSSLILCLFEFLSWFVPGSFNPKTLDLVDLQIIAMDNKEKISQLEKVKKEDEINVNNKKAEAKAKAKQELIDELKKATKETHSTNIP